MVPSVVTVVVAAAAAVAAFAAIVEIAATVRIAVVALAGEVISYPTWPTKEVVLLLLRLRMVDIVDCTWVLRQWT